MVIGKFDPGTGYHDLTFAVHPLECCPPKARSSLDECPSKRLGDIVRVDVAADDTGHHRPEGEKVIFSDDEDAHVFATLNKLAELYGCRVTPKSASHYENLILKLFVGRLLPRCI